MVLKLASFDCEIDEAFTQILVSFEQVGEPQFETIHFEVD
jgi:hypothetical protein